MNLQSGSSRLCQTRSFSSPTTLAITAVPPGTFPRFPCRSHFRNHQAHGPAGGAEQLQTPLENLLPGPDSTIVHPSTGKKQRDRFRRPPSPSGRSRTLWTPISCTSPHSVSCLQATSATTTSISGLSKRPADACIAGLEQIAALKPGTVIVRRMKGPTPSMASATCVQAEINTSALLAS